MEFVELAEHFVRLEKTASRLVMTEILAELFGEASSEEMPVVVNMSLGQLKPKFDRLEFNLAEKMVLRAIAEATGKPLEEVKAEYKKLGDVGDLVEKLQGKQENRETEKQGNRKTGRQKNRKTEKQNSVLEVYERLVKIAEEGGQGSQERKVSGLAKLLAELDGVSGKYVARLVVGKLRLGFSDMTILDALSWMEAGDKSRRKSLENAYQLHPDTGRLAQWVKEKGIKRTEKEVEVKLGVPVIPALAQRLKTAKEMIEKMREVGMEPKFDGTRVQIHYKKGQKTKVKNQNVNQNGKLFEDDEDLREVRTFTRNLDETTEMFPEIQVLGKCLEAEEVILDSEAVGRDPVTGKMLTFQETIKRKRKHGVAQAVKDIPLTFWVFDVLYKDGKSLVREPFYRRREILEETIKDSQVIKIDELVKTSDPDELREFHRVQLDKGLEGAVVKKWDGVYEPGRRGWSWVKFKERETSKAKLADTVDAVVMGLYVGKGKRTSFGVGAFLIGVRGDEETHLRQGSGEAREGKFYTVTKVGTGLTDEQWKELKIRSKKFEVRDKPNEYVVDKNLEPDVWLAPGLVVEIAADEITKSPIHTAGLALRFPRLVRFRDDKDEQQVTSLEELKKIG